MLVLIRPAFYINDLFLYLTVLRAVCAVSEEPGCDAGQPLQPPGPLQALLRQEYPGGESYEGLFSYEKT